MKMDLKNKIAGCIYGQAIGDALGLGTEFMKASEIKKIYPGGLSRYDQIIKDAHRVRWGTGAWTDDTDMMLCIARARQNNHFNLRQIAHNFKEWFNGDPMGIGRHTYNVLCMGDYETNPFECAEVWWKLSRCQTAANGSVMRTSILGTSPDVDEEEITDVCRLTHPDPRCIGSCVVIVRLIQSLIFSGKELNIEELKEIAAKYDQRILEYIDLATSEDPTVLSLDDIYMGYTLKTMAIALWALWHCNDFKTGLLRVVNLGGDADTNAAVACAVLGAKYGFNSIPRYYREYLHNRAMINRVVKHALADNHLFEPDSESFEDEEIDGMFPDINYDPIINTLRFRLANLLVSIELYFRFRKDPNKGKLGFCIDYWQAKKELLKRRYGIDWKTPPQLNPDVYFD